MVASVYLGVGAGTHVFIVVGTGVGTGVGVDAVVGVCFGVGGCTALFRSFEILMYVFFVSLPFK